MRENSRMTLLEEGWYSTDGFESRRKLRDHRGIRKRASEPRGRLIIRRISGGPQTARWWRCRWTVPSPRHRASARTCTSERAHMHAAQEHMQHTHAHAVDVSVYRHSESWHRVKPRERGLRRRYAL